MMGKRSGRARSAADRELQQVLTASFVEERQANRQFVSALARGLELLRAFKPFDGPLSNQELAARTGLPKPTVSRIAYTLTKLGYLEYVERLERYRLGPAVLALGYAFLGSLEIRKIAKPLMQEFADRTGATIALAAPDRLSFIMLEICSTAGSLRLMLDVGSRIEITQTPATAAYLAAIPAADQKIVSEVAAEAHPEEWNALQPELIRCRREIAEQGFCIFPSPLAKNVNVCASALLTPRRDKVLLFQAYAHANEISKKDFESRIGPSLVGLAERVRRESADWIG